MVADIAKFYPNRNCIPFKQPPGLKKFKNFRKLFGQVYFLVLGYYSAISVSSIVVRMRIRGNKKVVSILIEYAPTSLLRWSKTQSNQAC